MAPTSPRKEKIAKLRALPALARQALAGLDENALGTPTGEGKWTIRQVVHHLADSHLNGFVRTKLILTEEHPTLKPYDQDAWAMLDDVTEGSVESSLTILDGLHARWCSLLESLPESGWSRSAYHPENGEMTVDDILDIYARHGENHLTPVNRLRVEKGW